MIFSNKQLSIAQRELENLSEARDHAFERATADDDWVGKLQADALSSQIADIEVDIQEYLMLRDGEIGFTERYGLADLPRVLIQARIAQGLSQTELAGRLGMKAQQIQRYEASGYLGANLSRLIEIADELDVQVATSFSDEGSGGLMVWSGFDEIDWNRLPAKEMVSRGWYEPELGQSLVSATQSYFTRSGADAYVTAHHRKKLRGHHLPNELTLLAWQARILDVAARRVQEREIAAFEHNDEWLKALVRTTVEEDGPSKAVRLLEENGILFFVEPQLPGSYLDGAAMLAASGHPVIALTLRYDRLDNFWFVLFHELGHVYRHLFEHTHLDFFDEDGPVGEDALELEADQFALDQLIPQDAWNSCLSRFALSPEAVQLDARKLGVHHSIIAGRIRREQENYTILTDLIGQGEVRRQFEGEFS